MNWIDLLLVAVFLVAVWAGWHRGFILGTLDLVVWVGSFLVAYLGYPHTSSWFEDWFPRLGAWLLPAAFLSTLVIVRVLLGVIAHRVVRLIPHSTMNTGVNKLLGVLPGAVNGWICSVVLSALLLALPLKDSVTQETRDSKLAVTLGMQSEWANKKLAPVFDQAVRQTMNGLTVQPSSHKTIQLHFTYNNPKTRPFLEAKMLEMINEERAKEGLKPLQADPEMAAVARAHSKDMFARGYFAHNNPDGQDPFDRMEAAKVKFRTAGENLALAQTLEIAHTNLMNSPGHRANIMNPAFGRVGIGVLDGGFYGLMISQEFRD
jgi:uncharacterized protein YkwD